MPPLATIAAVALILLAAFYGTGDLRAHNTEMERLAQMQLLLPGSEDFKEIAYTETDANIERVFKGQDGYVIETCAEGYVAPIRMRVGVDNHGRVLGLRIWDMHETAGLGLRALRDVNFLSQFLGARGKAKVGENVDAISGATVTSKAIAQSVNSASAFVTGVDVSSGATAWGE